MMIVKEDHPTDRESFFFNLRHQAVF